MREEASLFPKIKYVLIEIAEKNKETYMVEIINHSFFDYQESWNYGTSGAHDIKILITPDIYGKHYNSKSDIEKIIKNRMVASTELNIAKVNLLPDYEKLELISSKVKPIYTKWEEINTGQQKLIETLKRSTDSSDYQNVGNTARTLMDKLARSVFNPDLHKSDDPTIELYNGKFKNQLNTYISSELKGKKRKDLKKLAISSIAFVEDAIDLMNTTTHKLSAEKHFAELCVIGAISAVSIIRTIEEL